VSALYLRPDEAKWLFVLAHGAGAGMRHPFMEAMARRLSDAGIATLRYQFPYMEHKSRRPDPKPILFHTVYAAVEMAGKIAEGLPLLAGGKSMGGRMTSMAAAERPLQGVRGIAFIGFPLHPPGKPSTDRAGHLSHVAHPMLFLQGTRDTLADLSLLRPVCEQLGERALLHVEEGADHSFHVPKSSGSTDAEVLSRIVETVRNWAETL
jgi:predicted alpha/beta-hydrolase family hydrolase